MPVLAPFVASCSWYYGQEPLVVSLLLVAMPVLAPSSFMSQPEGMCLVVFAKIDRWLNYSVPSHDSVPGSCL